LSLLLYPVSQVFLLALAGFIALWRGRRRGAMVLLGAALGWFYLAGTGAFGGWLMGSLEAGYPPVAAGNLPQADAIVLLGGAVHERASEDTLGDLNRWSDRLLFAAALYHEGKAPVIVISGGGEEGDPTEAELMRDILRVMGVPTAAMVLEEASRTTHDNARFTVPLLRERGWDEVLLVTSAFHMRRAVALFQRQGMAVIAAPTDHQVVTFPADIMAFLPTLGGLTLTTYALHERAGYLVYRARGWL
jgi:uncharacterized SAM-binding protein YcdF (DUF218 family)